jgi:hypothetical protein
MTGELAAAYQSGSQRARVVTEAWGESNLYCPNSDKSRAGREQAPMNREHATKSVSLPGLRYQTETRVFPVAARNTLVAVAPDGT